MSPEMRSSPFPKLLRSLNATSASVRGSSSYARTQPDADVAPGSARRPLCSAQPGVERRPAAWTPKRASQRSANQYFPSPRGAEEADVLSRGGSVAAKGNRALNQDGVGRPPLVGCVSIAASLPARRCMRLLTCPQHCSSLQFSNIFLLLAIRFN